MDDEEQQPREEDAAERTWVHRPPVGAGGVWGLWFRRRPTRPPTTADDRRRPPTTADDRRRPPTTADDRRRPPTTADDRRTCAHRPYPTRDLGRADAPLSARTRRPLVRRPGIPYSTFGFTAPPAGSSSSSLESLEIGGKGHHERSSDV
ncbi:hypothetical protein [Halobaculum lipolyticum]|uniref:hypothetical protein n=1 Tax=Halobaculum lipolyticum TaxID=3032001 RepID=UPI0024C3877A|nr:hypothetical protein [Halobaculum sp. DT31]